MNVELHKKMDGKVIIIVVLYELQWKHPGFISFTILPY